MAKLPAFQFYPGDWMKDPALRSVSLAARGLWIDMLCLMHESARRGYLQHATGKPVTAEQLARMTGCSTDDVSRLLQELTTSGVFSCTEHGVIYSRRFVREENKRRLCSEAGKKGGGNPSLTYKGLPKGVPKGRSKGVPEDEEEDSYLSLSSQTQELKSSSLDLRRESEKERRETLIRYKVKGWGLAILSACDRITVAQIIDLATNIDAGADNPPGVLVDLLCKQHGIEKPEKKNGTVASEVASVAKSIRQMRRQNEDNRTEGRS